MRVAAGPAGLGAGRAAPGRGAWVCSLECFDRAVREHGFDRALRRKVTNTDLDGLRATLFDARNEVKD